MEEVVHWQDRTILRVLISTALKAQKEPDLSATECTSKNEYFVRLDKNQTETLFGAAFFRLMQAMKNKESDIRKLDEITHGKRKRDAPGPANPRGGQKSRRS